MSVVPGFALFALAVIGGGSYTAQPGAGDLRWFVAVEGADTVPGKTRAFRVYDTARTIRLSLDVFNESDAPAFLDVGAFVEAIELEVGGDREMLYAELDGVQRSGMGPRGPVSGRVRVEPNAGITFRLRLQGGHQSPVAAGDYEIALDLGRATTTIEDGRRRPWRGQFLRRTTITLSIAPPKNSAERVAMLAFEAHNALTDNDLTAAEGLLLRALQEGPNQSLAGALGNLYVVQGRYREAIDTYEQAATGVRARDPQLLALAYVGMGDDVAAAQALRDGGWPEAQIGDEMRLLRGIVRRRALQ